MSQEKTTPRVVRAHTQHVLHTSLVIDMSAISICLQHLRGLEASVLETQVLVLVGPPRASLGNVGDLSLSKQRLWPRAKRVQVHTHTHAHTGTQSLLTQDKHENGIHL